MSSVAPELRSVNMRPPIRSRASSVSVRCPAAWRALAAANPETPAPMTMTSYRCSLPFSASYAATGRVPPKLAKRTGAAIAPIFTMLRRVRCACLGQYFESLIQSLAFLGSVGIPNVVLQHRPPTRVIGLRVVGSLAPKASSPWPSIADFEAILALSALARSVDFAMGRRRQISCLTSKSCQRGNAEQSVCRLPVPRYQHSSGQTGARFPRKAAMPSCASGISMLATMTALASS